MADEMKPTPRGFISGLFSDVLGRTMNMPSMPRTGIPSLDLLYANRNSLFNMAGVGDVQKTAERISYGQPLTTGSGMTLRPREETINAAMAVAPFAPVAGRLASRAVRATEGLPVGMSIKDVGKSNINVSLNEASNFLSAKSEFGQVGGTIRPPDRFSDKPYLQINYAEVEKASRGLGKGKELYQSLIDEAQARGLRVFSDSTVEKPAVNVYKSLEKGGYKLRDMTTGSLEDGAVYGAGASKPAFEISAPQPSTYPQQAALDLAQQRAALPVEQGGLGLLANNTAADRAKAMGFDLETFHGTDAPNIESLDPKRTKIIEGVFSAFHPKTASLYAEDAAQKGRAGIESAPNVMPLLLNSQSHFQIPAFNKQMIDSFRNSGYAGVQRPESGVAVTFDPAQIRSRFAAFDPFRKDVATATAMGVALPDLLAQPVNQYQPTYETTPMYTDPFGNTIGSSIR